MRYRVLLSPAATRQLDRIRGPRLAALRGAILALTAEPRPPASRKLLDTDLWRIRLRVDGEPWRIVYAVDDRERLVVITRVVRRSEATYRRL